MKSTVLHGENQSASRKKFLELISQAKSEGFEILRINWKKESSSNLKLLSRTQSLLSVGVCLAIENFFTGNKKALQLIEETDKNCLFIFWEDKTLTPATIKNLQNTFFVQNFPVPTVIFNFLNSLSPNNSKNMIKLFRDAVSQDASEMIYVLIARQLRLLYWVKTEPGSLKLPDWMKNRLKSQSEKFTEKQLIELHGKLLDLDRKSKRSQLPENLGASLELFLVNL